MREESPGSDVAGRAIPDFTSFNPGYEGVTTYQEKPPSKPRGKSTIIAAMIAGRRTT
jgi:hypothetical protein